MMMSKPFCASSPEAQALPETEFWSKVYERKYAALDLEYEVAEEEALSVSPCGVCGSTTACGYDSEGRPMIHCTSEEGDQDA